MQHFAKLANTNTKTNTNTNKMQTGHQRSALHCWWDAALRRALPFVNFSDHKYEKLISWIINTWTHKEGQIHKQHTRDEDRLPTEQMRVSGEMQWAKPASHSIEITSLFGKCHDLRLFPWSSIARLIGEEITWEIFRDMPTVTQVISGLPLFFIWPPSAYRLDKCGQIQPEKTSSRY